MKQPPAFINYDTPQYLLNDHSYGIQLSRRLKKTFQSLSFLTFKSKKNFSLLTMRWIFSRSNKLTRSNSFILHSKVLGDKVLITSASSSYADAFKYDFPLIWQPLGSFLKDKLAIKINYKLISISIYDLVCLFSFTGKMIMIIFFFLE